MVVLGSTEVDHNVVAMKIIIGVVARCYLLGRGNDVHGRVLKLRYHLGPSSNIDNS